MKEKIFGWLFKNELNNMYKAIEYNRRKLEKELLEKELEIGVQYALIKRILKENKEFTLMGIETNKKNEEVFVVKEERENILNFYLYGQSYMGNSNPFLHTSLKRDFSLRMENQYDIEIVELQALDKGISNGTIMMNYLERYIEQRKNTINSVKGTLSYVDRERFDKLERFYSRSGYSVSFNDSRTAGSFIKHIPYTGEYFSELLPYEKTIEELPDYVLPINSSKDLVKELDEYAKLSNVFDLRTKEIER